MDKQYDKQLLNEMANRMKMLYEYTFYQGVREDENEPQQDNNQMGGDPNMMMGGEQPQQDNNQMGGDPNMMGNDPNMMMGGEQPQQDNGEINGANLAPNAGMDDMNQDNQMGGDPNMMGNDPNMMGGDPNMMMGNDPNMMMGGEQPGPEDDVVDITSLTDAQEELNQTQTTLADQMTDVDSKLTTLMKIVDKFSDALEANDAKIKDLTQELVKRNPTDEETMNVRLHAGGNPFDQKPEEFWTNFKDINNHYNITANNDAPQTYEIRKSDVDNFSERILDNDYKAIPNSLKEYFKK
jgi:hypothetical protein